MGDDTPHRESDMTKRIKGLQAWVRGLACGNVGDKPIGYTFSCELNADYGDRHDDAQAWEEVRIDPDALTLDQCRQVLEHHGRDLPSPNPWAMDADAMRAALSAEPDEYAAANGWTADAIRPSLIEAIDDEALDGLQAWQDAARDVFDESGDTFVPVMSYAYPAPYVDNEQAAQLLLHLSSPLCLVRIGGDLFLGLQGGGMDFSWEICEAYTLLGALPPVHFCDLPGMAGRGRSERDRRIIAACKRSCRVLAQWARETSRRLDRL